jgi:hypothetical protein
MPPLTEDALLNQEGDVEDEISSTACNGWTTLRPTPSVICIEHTLLSVATSLRPLSLKSLNRWSPTCIERLYPKSPCFIPKVPAMPQHVPSSTTWTL